MNSNHLNPFFSAQKPFFWNPHGWQLFLEVRQTTLGPLHMFQGAVRIKLGQTKTDFAEVFEDIECSRHHLNRLDAMLDAIDLAHVTLAAINAVLFTRG